ncbi:hypothetical protein EN866_33555 [Mesorhizobium sp. M2D.F.Ca.ET.223.01.1.1]|uniref:hypothetical protein n=1 Tax=Mesorhizobium sp. M2D.F.Ca.ET.223.01.1.1 TaxID=2563940 RepID=UPI0010926F10|nr:hypothetical protein [Mesorhizobium sp. M2D.F.Ca.ET.223.01.1.1]TGR84244.1 hypothetical protein EN866_33555 [Mesorhizobium sp. M2D.F.Ca.ET.223.01.1.1]TGT75999.1 hypothetical protein EN802_07195 [bacterium M00.F.Ca.ET.159.01.1.1]TGT85060.1 hypothetical protein EN800_13925 [bacterium M00.F.Ca.ET.157.01.1.1]
MRSTSAKGVTIAVTLLFAGCQGAQRWSDRYGPDPELSASDIRQIADQQDLVLKYLTTEVLHKPYPIPDGSDEWYFVADAGFNYVDQKCDTYLYDLYVRSKELGRTRALITATDKATSAILSVSGVSTATMGMVAQAFGLVSATNDAFGESYLLTIGPTAVSSTVKKLQTAYREQALEDQIEHHTVAGPTVALSRMRRYLQLCMPAYIEAQITDYVAKADAGDTGSTVKPKNAPPKTPDASVSVTLKPPQ